MRHTVFMLRVQVAIFTIVFVIAGLLQWHIWDGRWSVDDSLWKEAAESHATFSPIGPEHGIYGYPAMTILVPAGALIREGVPPMEALSLVMRFSIAVAIALTAVAAYAARLRTLWWAFVAFMLAVFPFYIAATAPVALSIPLVCLFLILTLTAYERPHARNYLLLGLCGGILLATRFEIAAILLGSAILLLRFSSGRSLAFFIPVIASFITFTALDPVFLANPWMHLTGIAGKIFEHAEGQIRNDGAFLDIFLRAPYAGLAAFALGVALLALRKLRTLPARFILWYALASTIMLTALSFSVYHPVWILFPIIVPWTMFLPFFAYDAYRSLRLPHYVSPEFIAVVCAIIFGAYYLFDFLVLW